MDITLCKGDNCPVKEKCHRYKENPEIDNPIFLVEPYIIDNGVFKCDLFWGDYNQDVMGTLLDILKGK